jgi:hypothetical protein
MESHYILNIARQTMRAGQPFEHFARVRLPQSKAQEAEAIADTLEIARRFPSSEGWKIELTYWEGRGYNVAFLDC